VRSAKPLIIAALIALALALPLFTSGYVVNILTQIYLYTFLAGAWNIMALSGLVSLGHAAFFGLGSYTATWLFLAYGVTPALGWMGGALLAGALAFVVYWIAFRCGLRGIYFGGLTLVLAEGLRFAAINSPALGRSQGLELVRFNLPSGALYALTLSLMVGGMLLTWWILRSPFGYRLQAIRDNELAAEAAGVNTFRAKLAATIVSAGLTAVGGTVSALLLRFVEPDSDFGLTISLNLLLGTFLGGTGTILGPGVGIAVLFGLREGIALLGEQVAAGSSAIYSGQQIIYGLILMGVVVALPEGLVRRITSWMPRRPAREMAVTVGEIEALNGDRRGRERQKPAMAGTVLLEVEGLTKTFRGLRALHDVTFGVRSGEILGIIGPNGAGKTTLFNVISGVHPPSAGRVRFKGRELAGFAPSEVCRRGVARTFQVVRPFVALSVLDNVVIGALAHSGDLGAARRRSREVIEFVGLGSRQDVLAGALTLQDRKLLEFARALATGPELLLLDEVMAGLNQREQERVAQTIRRIRDRGVTVLIIEHVMRAVMGLSDRLLVLDHGLVMTEGLPEVVAHDERVIAAYLGAPVATTA
jgi:ABC-type branched-subunit amino acid transport system ATPase component/ABC-type branched-subunit amino acid transport system permease subunit